MKVKNICILMGLVMFSLFLSEIKFFSNAQEKDKDLKKEYKTKYVSDWKALEKIWTPLPPVKRCRDYIELPNPKDAEGFMVESNPNEIKLDTDGDGKIDKTLKKTKEGIVTYKYGPKQEPYAIRIWQEEKEGTSYWCYQRAGFREAQAEGETFILIDNNTNGYYNEYGTDVLLVGKGKYAGPLSNIVILKGKLYEFDTDDFGTKISLKPYQGPTGEINLTKDLNFKHKPQMVILQSGDTALNIPLEQPSYAIPVGEYQLFLAIFTDRIWARHGSLPPIGIDAGQQTTLKWGGPFNLKIQTVCEKGGELVTITPPAKFTPPEFKEQKLECPFIKMDAPQIVGKYGEEYFAPDTFKRPDDDFILPDPGITRFDVEIIAEEASGTKYPKGKILNKIGNYVVDCWTEIDLSGLVQKRLPFWRRYQCPLYEYKGSVLVKVWTKSQIFGGTLSYEEKFTVK